jgi:hypothetical protein
MLLDANLALGLLAILFIWLLALTILTVKITRSYRFITKGALKTDWVTFVEKILRQQEAEEDQSKKVLEKITQLEHNGVCHLQKVGLVRFNPFTGTGGNHSFTLALLDGEESGILISSLHSRENTRIYIKPVSKAKPVGYEFSKEEQEAIEKAIKYGK